MESDVEPDDWEHICIPVQPDQPDYLELADDFERFNGERYTVHRMISASDLHRAVPRYDSEDGPQPFDFTTRHNLVCTPPIFGEWFFVPRGRWFVLAFYVSPHVRRRGAHYFCWRSADDLALQFQTHPEWPFDALGGLCLVRRTDQCVQVHHAHLYLSGSAGVVERILNAILEVHRFELRRDRQRGWVQWAINHATMNVEGAMLRVEGLLQDPATAGPSEVSQAVRYAGLASRQRRVRNTAWARTRTQKSLVFHMAVAGAGGAAEDNAQEEVDDDEEASEDEDGSDDDEEASEDEEGSDYDEAVSENDEEAFYDEEDADYDEAPAHNADNE